MKRSYVVIAVVLAAAVAAFVVFKGDKKKSAKKPVVAEKTTTKKRVKKQSRTQERGNNRELSVLQDDDPVGTLRLEGRVEDNNGKGVGGAVVIIDSVPPRTFKSEEDGSFAFGKLVGRPYRLFARAKEGVAGPVTARLTDTNDPVILRLKPASGVEVTVVDVKTNKPIAGAVVELRRLDVQTATSNDKGVATISGVIPGRYSIAANAPGYAQQHAWLGVAPGKSIAKTQLALRRGARVAGKVMTKDGEAVVGARVLYSGASNWAQQADARHDAAVTDKSGEFSFPALPKGSFRFVARFEKFEPGSSKIIELDGVNEKVGIEILMEPGATIRGKVVTKQGEAAPSSRVRIAVKSRGFGRQAPRQTYANEHGEFLIEGLPKNELELVALHESGSSEVVEVNTTEGGEHKITITLDIVDTISGIVVDSNGEPIVGAQVWGWPDWRKNRKANTNVSADWRLRGRNTEMTDAGGKFTLQGIKPGAYQLRASPPNATVRGWGWFRDPVDAQAGDKNVKIELPADGGVKGKVVFRDGKVPVAFTVSMGGWGGGTPFASKDGKFELKEMPPRKYKLSVRGAFDTRIVSVELEPGQTKDLGTIYVRQGRILAGKVVMNGQAVADATVRAGRILFGDGSSSSAGRGGPPGGRSAKQATTDEDGVFIIYGVGLGDLAVVAEHDQKGRSRAIAIRQTRESVRDMTLTLEPFGSLEGVVMKNGKPQSELIVNAASQTVPGALFGVRTGADGKFRFDRLAPDSYKVSAMVGIPMTGMGFHSYLAAVKSGETSTVNIIVNTGAITLKVAIAPNDKKEAPFTQVFAVRGGLQATQSARELNLAIAQLPESYNKWTFAFGGAPASVKDIIAAQYMVCVVPYPREVSGMGGIFEYMGREGDNLKCFCKAVPVPESPAEQSVSIAVDVPEFVPAPKQDDEPAGG